MMFRALVLSLSKDRPYLLLAGALAACAVDLFLSFILGGTNA